jgi:GNAT superfamily N-acetyltransferase
MHELEIRPATAEDVTLVLTFIRELAAYERLAHEMVATEDLLRTWLFGASPKAEVILGFHDGRAVAFAVFFHNFSTFLGRPGIYLEDLFVKPESRGRGFGKAMLAHLARLAVERGCGRLEWAVLDWNAPAIRFYKGLGAEAMDEWTIHRMTGDALRQLAAGAEREPGEAGRG